MKAVKNILIVALLLVSLVSNGQTEVKGQAVFTKETGIQYANRLKTRSNQNIYYDEISEDIQVLNGFYTEVIVNNLPDTGRWANGPDVNTMLLSEGIDGKWSPQAGRANNYYASNSLPLPYTTERFASERIHIAAKWAYALNLLDEDFIFGGFEKNSKVFAAEFALAVFKELHAMSQDDKLDFSNGGMNREVGEPTRPNTSFMTGGNPTERWNLSSTVNTQSGSPYMVMCAKVSKNMHSLGLIYELVKDTPEYINNHEWVDYWFLDAARWAYYQIDVKTTKYMGTNWRAFQKDWDGTEDGWDDSYVFTEQGQYVHYTGVDDSDPNNLIGINPEYDVRRVQQLVFNNRELDFIELVSTYAVYYDNHFYTEWTKDMYKAMLAVSFFPDMTFYEAFRDVYDPKALIIPKNYVQLSAYIWAVIANTHYVAVKNGIIKDDADWFFEFSTTLSSADLYTDAWPDPSSTEDKNMTKWFLEMAKIHRDPAFGGKRGTTYNKQGIKLDPTTNSIDTRRLGYALFNTWAQHPELDRFLKKDGYGYAPYVMPSFVESQAAWYMYCQVGGETGILNVRFNRAKTNLRRR